MKKLILLLAVPLLAGGCAENPEMKSNTPPCGGGTLSTEEARMFFETRRAMATRTDAEGAAQDAEPLMPGDVSPQWNLASESAGGGLHQVEVPVETSWEYCQFVWTGTRSAELYPVPRDLVVMKDPQSGKMEAGFRFFIPDAEFAEYYAAQDARKWATSDPEGRFTGVLLYTTVSGAPVSVAKWLNGRMLDEAFLFDKSRSYHENLQKMVALLGRIYMARVPRAETRAPQESTLIEEVVCVGYAAKKKIKFPDWDRDITPDPRGQLPVGDNGGGAGSEGFFGSGGSGGGNSGDDSSSKLQKKLERYRQNPNISTNDPEVLVLLDKMDADCMGAALIGALNADITIRTGYFGSGSEMIPRTYTIDGRLLFQDFEIRIGTEFDDIVLLEELLHVYQYLGHAEMDDARMNREVEAKLGWYMYRQRANNMKGVERKLGGKKGFDAFDQLGKMVNESDMQGSEFHDIYDAATEALRSISAYGSEDKYPFDPGKKNFADLIALMEDCIKKIRL